MVGPGSSSALPASPPPSPFQHSLLSLLVRLTSSYLVAPYPFYSPDQFDPPPTYPSTVTSTPTTDPPSDTHGTWPTPCPWIRLSDKVFKLLILNTGMPRTTSVCTEEYAHRPSSITVWTGRRTYQGRHPPVNQDGMALPAGVDSTS